MRPHKEGRLPGVPKYTGPEKDLPFDPKNLKIETLAQAQERLEAEEWEKRELEARIKAAKNETENLAN